MASNQNAIQVRFFSKQTTHKEITAMKSKTIVLAALAALVIASGAQAGVEAFTGQELKVSGFVPSANLSAQTQFNAGFTNAGGAMNVNAGTFLGNAKGSNSQYIGMDFCETVIVTNSAATAQSPWYGSSGARTNNTLNLSKGWDTNVYTNMANEAYTFGNASAGSNSNTVIVVH